MEALKIIIVLILFFAICPGLALFAKNFKKGEETLLFLLVFSTASSFPWLDLSINYIPWYRGTSRGFEFSVMDILTVALFFLCMFTPRLRNKWTFVPFNSFFYIGFFVVATISLFLSSVHLYGWFEVTKWIRAYFLYLVAYNYIDSTDKIKLVLKSLGWVIFYEAGFALFQRYVLGFHRVAGSMSHYNELGTYTVIVIAVLLSVIFDGNYGRDKFFYWISLIGAMGIVILTLSRGALINMVIVFSFVFVFSIIRKFEVKKLLNVLGFLVICLLILSVSADSIIERFQKAPESSGESRVEYNDVASYMIKDHFWFGVGPNNFSHSTINYYYPRTGLNQYGTPAHNIYFLTFAETGFIGLGLFLIIWGRFIYIGLAQIFRRRTYIYDTVAMGVTIAYFAIMFQSLLEWVYRSPPVLFLLGLLSAILVGIRKRYR